MTEEDVTCPMCGGRGKTTKAVLERFTEFVQSVILGRGFKK